MLSIYYLHYVKVLRCFSLFLVPTAPISHTVPFPRVRQRSGIPALAQSSEDSTMKVWIPLREHHLHGEVALPSRSFRTSTRKCLPNLGYRNILKLQNQGHCQREIERELYYSRHTISEVLIQGKGGRDCLLCSWYTYAEACDDMRQRDVPSHIASCHEHWANI